MEDRSDVAESSSEGKESSLIGRFTDVFAAPGDAFAAVKGHQVRHAHWVIPLVLNCLVSIIYVVVMFSQPRILQQISENQEAAMQKQVEAGKITEAQKEQALEGMQMFMKPGIMMITGSFGAVAVSVLMLFAVAFGLWLLGRFIFKPPFAYFKAMEVVGLTSLISALGAIVSMLLMVITGQMQATLSPALLVSDFDPTQKTHAVLATLNVFSIWYVAVLALGLARMSGHSFVKAAIWLFLIWGIMKFGGILFMPFWGG